MDIQTIVEQLKLSENSEWEFKPALGGLPSSLWETYSAMANTDGGSIVLGIVEKHGTFEVQGIRDIFKLQKNIWDCVQDRSCVSKIYFIITTFIRSKLITKIFWLFKRLAQKGATVRYIGVKIL